MITCRPKSSSFFALIIFILVIFMLLFGTVRLMAAGIAWYHFIMLGIFSLLAIGILLRIMFAYKTLSITPKKHILKVKYPLRFMTEEQYELGKELLYWQDTYKTVNGADFLEIELRMKYGSIVRLNDKELSNVGKVLNFLRGNLGNMHRDKLEK
ncbi:hypothetical protein V6R21_25875 [Limibacter armeniacum]|uniref:hypothetical protein n=1 Tax=Limibacter armeniacum TaxID=466084 RepID=UPI002FE66315